MPHILDPQNIFPKRLGLMHGNTLVLEYYDLTKDKFKKHLMPFEVGTEPKTIVEQMFKNVKHVPFLKKVNPKNVRAVLEGNTVGMKKSASPSYPNYTGYQQTQQPYVSKYQPQPTYEQEKENIEQQYIEPKERPKLEIFTPPIQQQKPVQQKSKAPQPPPEQQYYDEQFEDFQVSQSMDKPKEFTSSLSKVEPSGQKSSVSKSSEPSYMEPAKKKKEKEVAPVEEVIQEDLDDFDFLDGDNSKKDKPKKKEKSKSKEKKPKKQKKEKKEKKTKEVKKEEPAAVQDQFEFL